MPALPDWQRTQMQTPTLYLTKKELAARWQCSTRTVERAVRQFGLLPDDFIGHQPVFHPAAVARMEARRREHRAKTAGYNLDNGKIVTPAEARRAAGRGKR
jgi:hypothetical protein